MDNIQFKLPPIKSKSNRPTHFQIDDKEIMDGIGESEAEVEGSLNENRNYLKNAEEPNSLLTPNSTSMTPMVKPSQSGKTHYEEFDI